MWVRLFLVTARIFFAHESSAEKIFTRNGLEEVERRSRYWRRKCSVGYGTAQANKLSMHFGRIRKQKNTFGLNYAVFRCLSLLNPVFAWALLSFTTAEYNSVRFPLGAQIIFWTLPRPSLYCRITLSHILKEIMTVKRVESTPTLKTKRSTKFRPSATEVGIIWSLSLSQTKTLC